MFVEEDDRAFHARQVKVIPRAPEADLVEEDEIEYDGTITDNADARAAKEPTAAEETEATEWVSAVGEGAECPDDVAIADVRQLDKRSREAEAVLSLSRPRPAGKRQIHLSEKARGLE